MLFPNFYVASVNSEFGLAMERSRMSLSHPARREQVFQQFHPGLTPNEFPGSSANIRTSFAFLVRRLFRALAGAGFPSNFSPGFAFNAI